MSADRSGVDADDHADHVRVVARSARQAPDEPHGRRSVEVASGNEAAREAPGWKPAAEERIEAHRRTREAADAAYAAWARTHGSAGSPAGADTSPPPGKAVPAREAAGRGNADSRATRSPDQPPATGEALRKRVSELEADKAARDQQLAAQAKTIAEQGERIERLEAYASRITTAVRELRQAQGEHRPSDEIASRAGGEPADRAKPHHKRRMPTDAVNNVISVAAGGAITDLAYHLRDLPPEYASIGATGVALGAGIIAIWRERRKAKDDADHRPQG